LELGLKRFFRRGTRWYVWEQINFNAAIHHAFHDLLPLLAASEHELERLRVENAALRDELEQQKGELAALQAETLAALRERDEHLREEQRVCFKQVTLEMSEAATLEDRSRRKTDTLLTELQRRLDEIEKKSGSDG
jgi:predicted  nucleic acid-binding Zn-ribbon protein